MSELYIGLMSGTSMDGVDGVLVDFSNPASGHPFEVKQHAHAPFPEALGQAFWALNSSGPDEIHRAALAANELAGIYSHVVGELLALSAVPAESVRAIGAHGQTVRHRPQEFDGTGYTIQINNPALLAELTGIDVVADFRSRDVAAGGQGAPLVPAFHREVFGRSDEAVAVLNIGGISNVSLIPAQSGSGGDAVLGFDCGPGNALMDYWCQVHTGAAFDDAGRWAASGHVHAGLLQACLQDPYFGKAPPKSTGRDLFNVPWLLQRLAGFAGLAPADVQATLTELTATACIESVASYQNNSVELIVCGGGALNTTLMRQLQRGLQDRLPGVLATASDNFGLPALQVEATAFAWLARKAVRRETGSLPTVTGARKGKKKGADGARILGAIYPGF